MQLWDLQLEIQIWIVSPTRNKWWNRWLKGQLDIIIILTSLAAKHSIELKILNSKDKAKIFLPQADKCRLNNLKNWWRIPKLPNFWNSRSTYNKSLRWRRKDLIQSMLANKVINIRSIWHKSQAWTATLARRFWSTKKNGQWSFMSKQIKTRRKFSNTSVEFNSRISKKRQAFNTMDWLVTLITTWWTSRLHRWFLKSNKKIARMHLIIPKQRARSTSTLNKRMTQRHQIQTTPLSCRVEITMKSQETG